MASHLKEEKNSEVWILTIPSIYRSLNLIFVVQDKRIGSVKQCSVYSIRRQRIENKVCGTGTHKQVLFKLPFVIMLLSVVSCERWILSRTRNTTQ